MYPSCFLFLFFYSHLRTHSLILERGEGRESRRETSLWETNTDWLPLTRALTRPGEPNPKPRHVPSPGVEPATFWLTGNTFQPTKPHRPGHIPKFYMKHYVQKLLKEMKIFTIKAFPFYKYMPESSHVHFIKQII